ncbi:MAG TPA: CHAD domain-containing protein [Steroidobacteraceae bacterium]|nr:CHAD domain-containing protein [Steroidobacteraceae bacterium]
MNVPLYAVRDEFLRQLDHAVRALQGSSGERIHDVRKELKRARATLRLLRPCMGADPYRRENTILRDAARPLAPVRDAKVLMQAATRLLPDRDGNNLAALRRELRTLLHSERLESQHELRVQHRAAAADTLRGVASRTERLAHTLPDRLALSRGLSRVYKSGRKALARARRHPTDANLHECRKQAKYLLNQIDVAHRLGVRRLAKSHRRAHRLADVLGRDHDLAALNDKVKEFADNGFLRADAVTVEKWRARAQQCRSALQKEAFPLGRRLYAEKTGRFRAHLKMRKTKVSNRRAA